MKAYKLGGQIAGQGFQLGSLLNYNSFAKALVKKLTDGLIPASILVQGDSTGNGTNEWPYLITQELASKFPKYSVDYRLWNDTNQNYDYPARLATGSSGDAYVSFPGTNSNYINLPDRADIRVNGDIEIVAKIKPFGWGNKLQAICSKFGAAGNRGYDLFIDVNKKISFWYSSDGTANVVKTSTVALPFADGTAGWVKVTFDIDNGASGNTTTFYTSTDGATWTQLGTAIVTAGVTTLYPSTAPFEIGSRNIGLTEIFYGDIFKVYVKQGINGKIIAGFDAGLCFPSGLSTVKDAEQNTYTIANGLTIANGSPLLLVLNSSKAGAAIAYSKDATRFAKQAVLSPDLSFINYSHNEGANVEYTDDYQGLIDMLLAAYPLTGVVATAQNPQQAPETESGIANHAMRCAQIIALAKAEKLGLIDVYNAFVSRGDFSSLMADGVHPNADGQAIWVNLIKTFLRI